jgi:hypothetical protein
MPLPTDPTFEFLNLSIEEQLANARVADGEYIGEHYYERKAYVHRKCLNYCLCSRSNRDGMCWVSGIDPDGHCPNRGVPTTEAPILRALVSSGSVLQALLELDGSYADRDACLMFAEVWFKSTRFFRAFEQAWSRMRPAQTAPGVIGSHVYRRPTQRWYEVPTAASDGWSIDLSTHAGVGSDFGVGALNRRDVEFIDKAEIAGSPVMQVSPGGAGGPEALRRGSADDPVDVDLRLSTPADGNV